MVWSYTTNGHGPCPYETIPLEASTWKMKTWLSENFLASGHSERHQQNGLGLDGRKGRGCSKGADYVEVSLESGSRCSNGESKD